MQQANPINRELSSPSVIINKYLPIAILYFFFNKFLLPHGLLFTTLLSPLFIIWLFKFRSFRYVLYFFICTIPLGIIHFLYEVEPYFYFISYALFFGNFIFAIAFSQFVKICQTLRSIFRSLLIINIFFVVVACVAYFVPAMRDSFWQVTYVTQGLDKFPRLKLLTYEPSYYSLLLVPIAVYYILKIFFFDLPNGWLIIFLFAVPLLLAFSMGVLLGLPLAILILFVLNIRLFLAKKRLRRYILIGSFILIVGLLALMLLYPDNPLFTRIENLLEGQDSSFRGRTFDSYYLAWNVAIQKNVWFGVGLGQVKVLGLELWRQYYLYNFAPNEIAIPNAIAETFALYGFVGVFIRLMIELYFFFRTRVFSNYYRLALFIFILIYQFTGSYLFNIVEYVIWILAFNNTFPEFDKTNLTPRKIIKRFRPQTA